MFIYQSLFLYRGTDNHKAKPLCYLCFITQFFFLLKPQHEQFLTSPIICQPDIHVLFSVHVHISFQPLAVYLFTSKASKLANDEARQAKIVKFSESTWKLTYYASVQAWVLLIIKQEPWSLDTMQYFDGWPSQPIP
jgi:hypothetical protein